MYANPVDHKDVSRGLAARSPNGDVDNSFLQMQAIPFMMPMCPLTMVPMVTDGVMCPPEMFAAQYTAISSRLNVSQVYRI